MAIQLEIIQLDRLANAGANSLPILQAPFLKRTRVTAAGLSAALEASCKYLHLRNLEDAVHVRLNAESGDTTQAATTDPLSIKLRATTDELTFRIDRTLVGKVDVRAA